MTSLFVNEEHKLLDEAAHYALANYGMREAKEYFKKLIEKKWVIFMEDGCLWGVKLTTNRKKRVRKNGKKKRKILEW